LKKSNIVPNIKDILDKHIRIKERELTEKHILGKNIADDIIISDIRKLIEKDEKESAVKYDTNKKIEDVNEENKDLKEILRNYPELAITSKSTPKNFTNNNEIDKDYECTIKKINSELYLSSFLKDILPTIQKNEIYAKEKLNRSLNVYVDSQNNKKDLRYENKNFDKIELEQKCAAPSLKSNLMHVVRNPGIYPLSSVEKMSNHELKFFKNLPTPEMIQLENLDTYMKPYEDPNLKKLMISSNYKYCSSTSGIGETLAHFFYKLINFKSPHFYNLSEEYINAPLKYMMFQRKPANIVLHKLENKKYAISKNSIFDSKIEFILLKMGKYMEKLFTNTEEEFEKKYLKMSGDKSEIVFKEDDYFKFIGYDKILLRSQIDCGGKDKSGKDIVFEIKTRAVAPIRYDVFNYMDYLDYEVNSLHGIHSSYEREFYDLIRGAFLKYLFQLKIGGMDGALISYHNTQKIFGFEYISLVDMERRILGNSNFSDIIFKASLKLLQETLDQILRDFPDRENIFIGFIANEWKGCLDVFVELVDEKSYSDYEGLNAKNVIDYYYLTGYKPIVHKYTVITTTIINDIVTLTPIQYENNDHYNVKYQIIYEGKPSFDQYMKFLHESYLQRENYNLQTEFSGSWTSYENA